ncbi:unnamed protein product [Porites evermanni]|uniref:Ribosomal protein S2 n=1 Tax=Porites evermanni TaxID=104178 RepID=A0ABN8RB65_9CNID|nr:unnamed protein product [Porites evermanni]
MSQDKLLMNDAKTELLLIGTRQQLAKITIDGITVGHSVIAPQSPVRNLGSLSTLGDRSFYMAAPKLWNDLPFFIRNVSSVNAFKKALKTHLFQKAFPS